MFFLKLLLTMFLLFSLAGCTNTTTHDLKSHKWEFTAQKIDKQPRTFVKFTGKQATFWTNKDTKAYTYKLKKKTNGSTELILPSRGGASNRAATKHFNIKKIAKNYELEPSNKLTEHYYGEALLRPLAPDHPD